MSESEWRRSESYYLAYQRGAVVCLLFAVATGAYFLAAVFGGLSGWLVFDGAIGHGRALLTALLAVSLVTLRGRSGAGAIREAQLVLRDEWTRRNWNRACRIASAR
jgi:hypothetical protein